MSAHHANGGNGIRPTVPENKTRRRRVQQQSPINHPTAHNSPIHIYPKQKKYFAQQARNTFL